MMVRKSSMRCAKINFTWWPMSKDKRPLENDQDEGGSKRVKESYDILGLLDEKSENTLEAKDELINKLKAALNETYEYLGAWKDACPDFDPVSIKTELTSMKTLKAQLQEARKRDRSLVMRLSTKEQEIHDLQVQVNDFRQALSPHSRQNTLFDPAVNLPIYVQKLKEEIKGLERRLKQAQDDLEAQRFTPQSIMGRKLISKCKSLQDLLMQDENEELGKQLSEGKVHKLSQENALQREYSEELKSSLVEANEFVMQLDQEVEVLQQTVFTLQRQLKFFKERERETKTKVESGSSPSSNNNSGEDQKDYAKDDNDNNASVVADN